MHLLERIEHRWINDQDLQDLSEEGCRAVIDVLALAMQADGTVDSIELSAYEDMVFALPFEWENFSDLEAHARESKENAGELDSAAFEAGILAAGIVVPEEVGPVVFSMVCAILLINEVLEDAEAEVLGLFCEALEVDDHEARMIFDELVEELGLVELTDEDELDDLDDLDEGDEGDEGDEY